MENTLNSKISNSNTAIKSKQANRHKYYVKSLIFIAILLVLIFAELVNNGGYFDEIIGIVSAIYLIAFRNKISRNDAITIILLFSVIVIGIISNIVTGLKLDVFSILVDVVAETKLLFSFFAAKYFLSDKEKQATINMLLPLSKLFVISAFACGVISLFTDIGMSGYERYGIDSFNFIFNLNVQYTGVYMLIFGILVCNNKMTNHTRNIYYFMAIVSLLLSTKSPAILFSVAFIGLAIYFKNHDKLSPAVIILGIIIIFIVGQYQIEEYLVKENSPRRIFLEYAFRTANNYFPLGSGFATYGSDQAARVYSKLYRMYGFHKILGMMPDDPSFLSDTFWPMAVAQFGWIGFIIYMVVYIRIFQTFTNKNYSNQRRAYLYGVYLQYMINGIGAATLSSSLGLIGFMSLSLFIITYESEKPKRPKIKFKY